jgi:hypothetical protein
VRLPGEHGVAARRVGVVAGRHGPAQGLKCVVIVRVTVEELANVIAFLLSLRGEK